MSDSITDPPREGEDDTRTIVTRLERDHREEKGASRVWRALGGVAVTVGLAIAAWGVTYAQQAAVDHERVDRLETEVAGMHEDLDAIRESLARIEGRLERREED